jgi:hypothetical protein
MAETNEAQYVDPSTVNSPQRSIADLWVLFDGGLWKEGDLWSGWSVARMTWEGDPNAVGCRWNGEKGVSAGSPSSRGYPTWFIIPAPLAEIVVEAVNAHLGGEGDQRPNRLRRCINELLAAARAATSEEMTRLQLHL